jgi:tRNA threonylcarbamoyladenosine biosynthesis protein TsaE
MTESKSWPAPDETATAILAATLAPRARAGDVILLSGPLGAGKTSFARAFIRARTNNPALDIPSPTFTLVQTYEAPSGDIWHYDLWRAASLTDLEELAWDEARAGIVLVEWPDRLGPLAPPDALHITITLDPPGRVIKLSGPARWFDAS